MPNSTDRHPHRPPLNRRTSWPDAWFKDKPLKHVVFRMHLQSLSTPPSPPNEPCETPALTPDPTSLLSDRLLVLIFSKLPESQYGSNSLVCKRWLDLHGQLIRSLKLSDWDFVESGRVVRRFPNLTVVDLVPACICSPRNSSIIVTHKLVSAHLDSRFSSPGFIGPDDVLPSYLIDRGLRVLAAGCPNLRKLVLIGPGMEGLACVAEMCPTLQELELHCCTDISLQGISGCMNLQILKLIGWVDGFYNSVITDIGLTFLAQGCRRLVKLELVGCEGSYDGIKAIGQCCQMLEELSLFEHRMDGGWLAALAYCGNLKTLKLQSCKNIDSSPGPDEHLEACPTLEELYLYQCQLRDKRSLQSLFLVCGAVREIAFVDCWGLDNDTFSSAADCRRVRCASLEGCSLLTTDGLNSVIPSWNELQRLRVVSCNNIRNREVTPAMTALFSVLKELKWRPDSRSLLSSTLAGTGVRNRGRRFFKRA